MKFALYIGDHQDMPDKNWRKSCAIWFASQMLDDFDPDGPHIKHKEQT